MCKHLFMCWPWSTLKHFNCPDSHTHSPTAWRCLCECVCVWKGSKRKLRCSVTQTNALRVDVGQRLQMTLGKRASPAASLHLPASPSHRLPFCPFVSLSVCLSVCQVVLPIQISNLSGICNCIFAPSGIRNNLLALICQPGRQPCRQPVAHVVNPILRARGPASRPCSCCCIFTVIENGIKCFANTVR